MQTDFNNDYYRNTVSGSLDAESVGSTNSEALLPPTPISNKTKPRSPLDKEVNQVAVNQISNPHALFVPATIKWSKNPIKITFTPDSFKRWVETSAASMEAVIKEERETKNYEKERENIDQLLKNGFINNA